MRYRYEQKTADEAGSINQRSPEDNDLTKEDETPACSSKTQDVTDIFITVPSLPERLIDANNETSTTDLETTADVHVSSESGGIETSTADESQLANTEEKQQQNEHQPRRRSETDEESED